VAQIALHGAARTHGKGHIQDHRPSLIELAAQAAGLARVGLQVHQRHLLAAGVQQVLHARIDQRAVAGFDFTGREVQGKAARQTDQQHRGGMAMPARRGQIPHIERAVRPEGQGAVCRHSPNMQVFKRCSR